MEPDPREIAFIEGFQERLARTRDERGLTQLQVATALGLKVSTYKKYETRPRSAFPLYLLPALSVLMQRPVEFWIYGREMVPARKLRSI